MPQAPDYRAHVPLVYYEPGEWKRQVISDANEGVQHGIFITDWDHSGRDAILTASFSGIHLLQLGAGGTWKRTELSSGAPEAWPKCGSSDVDRGTNGPVALPRRHRAVAWESGCRISAARWELESHAHR